uniref:EF-hand domain-containing protein n=1 Tax=Pyrodinium bahamense TaxID=73915 RepID=A0A7S0A930_9DINO|mmetsp:Transcript_27882/g.76688  ORF Transcript_27882/g.76688 Transcript_27882/m.76688 type:complete len:185 (+) Transcript_27882:123-677(+)|eukprot:CAMPEP_0179090724 /NCGR_PEP_ID=MMETSP0796-20121207/41405_1 /TAXON_ID=73915 /ORGANISM="Pyrodinium bahamense, Strain pbaha01" /LENGTH=184 /DNA_ID=CAMNT_0020788299 /DNA_START=116 /DNA_END=670 /DNA_ORIENTATION=+
MGNAFNTVVEHVLSDCRITRRCDGYEEPGIRSERLEGMMEELFRLHDLNANGTLEEVELVKLNEKIAILHRGVDADRESVRNRYRTIFRAELDPEGEPVPYVTFRKYMFRMLDSLDPDEPTQAMIMDQFIAEADLALAAFPGSLKVRPGTLAALPAKGSLPQFKASEVVISPTTMAMGVKYGGG